MPPVRPMVLARCINGAYSEILVGGEYYLLEQAPRSATVGTTLHQGNVKAYIVTADQLIDKNFQQDGELFLAHPLLVDAVAGSESALYVGPRYRFELIINREQFRQAVHLMEARRNFSKSAG